MSHSRLSPSKSARYLACPGSVALEATLPDTTTLAAAEGTCFHQVAEWCASFGFDPAGFVGWTYRDDRHGEIVFSQEMSAHMREGLDFLESFETLACWYETKVPLDPWLGAGEAGTADFCAIDVQRRKVVVFDWKYGMVPVLPEENSQAMLYALGFWHTHGRHLFGGESRDIEVELVIEQPRAPGGGGSWTCSMDELLAWGETVKPRAAMTRQNDAPRVPGEKQCRFCRAARYRTCPEYVDTVLSLFEDGDGGDVERFEPVGLGPDFPYRLSDERGAWILKHAPLFQQFLKRLHADAYNAAKAGKPWPGMKLVQGRTGKRQWRDQTEAESALVQRFGEDAYVKKLVSPAQVEGLIGRSKATLFLKTRVETAPGKLVLVDASDARPAVESAETLFDENGEDGEDDEDDAYGEL